VAKTEWGEKRECPECGARFYDLKRSPAVCPKCETSFVAVVEKTPPPPPPPELAPVEKVAPVAAKPDEGDAATKKDDDTDGLGDIVVEGADDSDDEDDDLIEEAADLDGDDDMSDVLDGAIDETKTAE